MESIKSSPIMPEYFSKEFLAQTRMLFEPIAGKELSDEECAEIARQTIELELYLQELRRKYENK